MKLKLSRNYVAQVDPEDHERLKDATLGTTLHQGKRFAVLKTWVGDRSVKQFLHRVILGVEDKSVPIEHVNGDTLDCRRENLKVLEKPKPPPKPPKVRPEVTRTPVDGYRGVVQDGETGRYMAVLITEGFQRPYGRYETPEQAALAYDVALRCMIGAYAKPEMLNFPDNWLPVREYPPKAAS
jgi:hypothetical protein